MMILNQVSLAIFSRLEIASINRNQMAGTFKIIILRFRRYDKQRI
jgi:hypothetical protein